MTPEEVLERARQAESLPESELHPLIGSDATAEDVLDVDPALTARRVAPAAPRPRTYCDSCGHVDTHATDCPQQVMLEVEREARRDEALERAEAAESIPGLVRKLGATILRRLAKRLDP